MINPRVFRLQLARVLGPWLLLLVLVAPRVVVAQDFRCEGPAACCPETVVHALTGTHVSVAIGVVLNGLSNVNERSGTWDADYYLYEAWQPTPGFTPRTEIVNEVSRGSSQFDDTELRDGRCLRSRRLRSTLHSSYNLHAFPFDRQHLTIVASDEQFDHAQVSYEARPYVAGVDDAARDVLSGWEMRGEVGYAREVRAFRWEPGAPRYDYATFALPVARHITFHLTKFFLPLFVIVAIAFSVFWIDPEDLGSQVGIGVTCILAAIAFQFAEQSNLPEIAYLTFADRVYAICYLAMALALLASIYTNRLARDGRKELAVRLDRRGRTWFPAGLLASLIIAVIWSAVQSRA